MSAEVPPSTLAAPAVPMTAGALKRPVVIDGTNFVHKIGDQMFDFHEKDRVPRATAILALVYDLVRLGHPVGVVLKAFFNDPKHMRHMEVLKRLIELGLVTIVPDDVDDDAVVLDIAKKCGGFVISNDQFRQTAYDRFDEVRTQRRVGFFADSDETFDQFKTPFTAAGRCRFNLKIRVDVTAAEWSAKTTCSPGDPGYDRVALTYELLTLDYFEQQVAELTVLADFVRLRFVYIYTYGYEKRGGREEDIEGVHYFDHLEEMLPKEFCQFHFLYEQHKKKAVDAK
ncbi:hypothetical protein M3Y99_00851100 [Aphelenchoides fujianensis]|nr:hypothetical protein M3Y99_00851100 [Aphelenchoides fujianensis]